ncbi:MAG: histidine kinase [Deltaproteobacteria bacterium]|nr:histidine kinase [Deltaproteobacteria bacterium]
MIKTLLLTAVFNTVIALFLTLLGFKPEFLPNFIFSQAIGLSICSCILAGHYFFKNLSPAGHFLMVLGAMVLGVTAGAFFGSLATGSPLAGLLRERQFPFIQMLILGILFGTIITYFFFSREKISQTESLLREEQIKGLTLEKKALETRLRMLQAQIEPHFLFNSLSNILSLIDSDPARGKTMLVDLTRYLRASLTRTREGTTTLGQEMDLIRAYLAIQEVRMSGRLRYSLDIQASLRDRPFPPLLVQPVVENALQHGIEPKIEGGELTVRAEETADRLRLVVADTGLGLNGKEKMGIGLTNVRERLAALFDGRGRLILEENRPSGLRVTIEVPNEAPAGRPGR